MQKNLPLWLRNNIALLALLLVSALIYAPSLSGDFVIDDVPTIRDNPYIRDFSHVPDFFTKGVWANSALENDAVPIYRPMHLMVELLNHAAWGNKPVGYHVFLLLLHLANTCMLFVLIRKLACVSAVAAAMGAAIFALHPARVESVAWLSGITDPLAAFFLMGALLAHRSFTGDQNNWRYLALSLLCFQLALWSKEVAIILPLVLIVHDLVYRRKIIWAPVLLQTALVIAYLVSRKLALNGAVATGFIDMSQFSRAGDFALGYSELLAFPTSVPFYLQPPGHAVSSIMGVACLIAMIALAGYAARACSPDRRKTLLFSLCWAIAFFWPAILMMFYKDGYYSARFLYVPALGFAVFIAVFYEQMITNCARLKIPIAGSGILLLLAYGLVTWKEIPVWNNDERIYGKIASLAPESDSGYAGLGNYYFAQGDNAAAEKNFLLALQKAKAPQSRVTTLVLLGTIQGMGNNLFLSRQYFTEAAQIDPKNPDAWAGLGNLAWMQGQASEAISCYEKAISLRPGSYETAMNLAMAYEQTGQYERAASLRQQAAIMRR